MPPRVSPGGQGDLCATGDVIKRRTLLVTQGRSAGSQQPRQVPKMLAAEHVRPHTTLGQAVAETRSHGGEPCR